MSADIPKAIRQNVGIHQIFYIHYRSEKSVPERILNVLMFKSPLFETIQFRGLGTFQCGKLQVTSCYDTLFA